MIDLRGLLFIECPDCDGTGSLGHVLERGMAYRAGSVGRVAACERCGGTMDSLGCGIVLRDDIDEQEVLEALAKAIEQRDALLAACEAVVRYADHLAAPIQYEDAKSVLAKCEAAIALATKEA